MTCSLETYRSKVGLFYQRILWGSMKSPKLSESPGNDKLCNGGNNNNGEFCCVCLDHGCIERNLPNVQDKDNPGGQS